MTKFDEIEQLFRSHYAEMYRFAMLILRDDNVSRDIIHDLFEALLISGKRDVSVKYLLTSVRNRCLKHIRSLTVRDRFKAVYSADEDTTDDEDWPNNETIMKIQATMSHYLTDACRHVVELRYNEELSYQEIADALGISKVAVYKHLRHAIDILREKLSQNG